MEKTNAILLLGPTGSGKTPLGELLARRGLWRRPCRHFDFGAQMRRAVAGTAPANLTGDETTFLRSVLESGVLLEDEHFPIAERMLRAFLDEGGAWDEWILLNGLPRHAGQVRDVEDVVDVRAVVELTCEPETALARIRANIGGDRNGRRDDDETLIRRKLETYAERIAPLADEYRSRGIRVGTIAIKADTTAEDVWAELEASP